MEIKIADINDKIKWNSYVKENKGSFFHLWEWGKFLNEYFGYKMFYLMAKEGEKTVGVLPLLEKPRSKTLISLPLADFAGIIADNLKVHSEILNYIQNNYTKKDFFIYSKEELKNVPNGIYQTNIYANFEMEINGNAEEMLIKVIPQKTRNMINKSNRADLTIEVADDLKLWEKYYRLYYANMLHLKSLPLPFTFFRELQNLWKDKVKLFLVLKEKIPVSGLVGLIFEDKFYIWGNASDKKFSNLGANNRVYFEAIKFACENDLRIVNLGNTKPQTSHFFFKKNWGAKEKNIYVISNKKNLNTESKSQKYIMSLFQFLPRFVLEILSKLIYKYY